MIERPAGMGRFHFVAIVRLRAAQLMRGCQPTVELNGAHKATVIAQMEVAQGKIVELDEPVLLADPTPTRA